MSDVVVTTACDTPDKTDLDGIEDAREAVDTHVALCEDCTDGDVEIERDDAGEVLDAEPTTQDNDEVPQPSQLTSDPLDVISRNADQFTDTIKGTVTINRQGYAVLAERFGISVTAEPVTLPSETGFEYAEFRATATTEDGATYTGFGSAHVDRQDGDDQYLLAELAETRAMKRATAWATGVGMSAVEELEGEL
jgi:hypothetical protein